MDTRILRHDAETPRLCAIAFRDHPERGRQWWNAELGMWDAVPGAIAPDPEFGDPVLSYDDTWCEPEEA